MKISVLGGSGFIGTRLVGALLDRGHEVRIFDKSLGRAFPECTTIGDVRDVDAVNAALAGRDCAINLAAEHSDDVRPLSLYADVNIGGAQHLVQAAQAQGVNRIVFVSSVAVYGLNQPMANEDSPLRPANAYGRSKVAAEAVYTQWAAADAQRALTVIRPCVVFGEANRGNVYTLIDHLRRRRFVMVGDGHNRKSIAYVGNLVDFLCAYVEAGPGLHLYNYVDKPDLSTDEMVREICALSGQKRAGGVRLPYPMAMSLGYLFDAVAAISGSSLPISSARVRKFCADTTVAADKVQATGFVAKTSIREGLRRMIEQMSK